jgi:alkyl sulfatase BDS1-like metallo-beta-lactamase superfamily hydrolase
MGGEMTRQTFSPTRLAAGLAGLALALPAAAQPAPAGPDAPSAYTRAAQARTLKTYDFADRQDFGFADRGFLGTRADPLIKAANGRVVWDLSAFDFVKGPAPETVNPSLWRQAQLLARNGLFQAADRVYQVRGFDLANITFVRGDHGWIVIDTLTSAETAKAALDLANEKLGARPVEAIIYTHGHVDHFGGARGLVSQADVDSGKVAVIAPKGFLESAVSENVIAGAAMSRRAVYQFGAVLPKSPVGQVDGGIGPGLAIGTQTLIPPTRDIDHTGQTLTIDGVRFEFQLTPGTEAPAEMNVFMPDLHVLDLAENANATMHNILTPRGALVRDAKGWADYLTQSLRLYGDKADVMITSHAWPRFGGPVIRDFIASHRDAYAYLHDQTVRLMDEGLTGEEIAARLTLPAALEKDWFNHGYYGSMRFNSRAVYQRYMGWYDADPVHLAPMAPADRARRYVAAMGGGAKVLAQAHAAFDAGDYAWAAELLDKLVFADSSDAAARALLARTYDQLGYQSENALERNMYLTGASELRQGVRPAGPGAALDLIRNTPTSDLFDLTAVRLNPDKAGDAHVRLEIVFPERGERTYVSVADGVLTHEPIAAPGPVDATLTMSRTTFLQLAFLGGRVADKVADGEIKAEGDPQALQRLLGWLDVFRSDFPIVTR